MSKIEDIIKDIAKVEKLANSLSEASTGEIAKVDGPKAYREEYDGKRDRRNTSLERIQKDKIIGSIEEGTQKIQPVKRYVFNFMKKIVRFAVAMLFGGEMVMESDVQDNGFEDFKRLWKNKLKMQSKLKDFCRTVKIETKAALIFYGVEVNEKNLIGFNESKINNLIKARLISADNGRFAPHFDDYGDMDAFLYLRKEISEDNGISKPKEITIFDIYTDEFRIRYEKEVSGWKEPEIKNHGFSVIPVVYAEQVAPEWQDVSSLIDGYEVRVSKLGDANDYTGDPLLIVRGDANLPEKHQVGKVLSFKPVENSNGSFEFGDARYLTHDQLPASNKLEMDVLWNGIHSGTSTPDVSLSAMAGLGNIAASSLEMLFLDPILKATDDKEIFDPVVSRCVSIVKNGMKNIVNISAYKNIDSYDISISFNWPLPRNAKDFIELLGASVEAKTLSRKTAVEKHPFVKDGAAEFIQIQAEQKDELKSMYGQNNESFE